MSGSFPKEVIKRLAPAPQSIGHEELVTDLEAQRAAHALAEGLG